jgi:hypothetical protein
MARATVDQIEQLLKQYRERGNMTRRGFCESQGISLSMLDYYLRRYGKSETASVKLARVEIQAERTGRIALVLANGRRIECGEEHLSQLIRAAEGA